ncbi:J domain-containing protein [Pseudomonas sp. Fl5BN2]|uniref:J domain-containing protein n=1 Tax=Pseudomonas sp. Fl5BN2 TaxID=2697652 RepID=UPI001378ABEB|nr:J domain-containing protein [Pseudomonas sp. Fl5BN2]NBF03656.1 J domain-containing protein [Pseudomonas sp. Fl5BN2]
MDCWTLLELPADADARSIKRSYAKLLKSTRPEADAEGFQRLRAAYEKALQLARQRLDNRAEERRDHRSATPTSVTALVHAEHDNLHEWAQLLEIHPQEPTRPNIDAAAHRLLLGLTLHNLPQRWQQAQQLDCAQSFEAGLLLHCLERSEAHTAITLWAVEHLEWLTPWQNVAMSPWQQEALAARLLQQYQQTLQQLMAAQEEQAFIQQLSACTEQPWLQEFDRRQEWQRIVLQLLKDNPWSLLLLEQVCQLFQWSDKSGVHPEPTQDWEALMERRQQENFYRIQQLKSEDKRTSEPDILAAHLLLKPMTARQQQSLLRGSGQRDWQACHQLADILTWRYPQLIERLPQRDLYFWLRYLRRPVAAQSWVRLWAGTSLALGLNLLQQNHYSPGFSIITASLLGWVPVWIGILLMSQWIPLATRVISQDLWLSERLIPRRLDPTGKWLVLRHGLPQLVILAMFGALQGALGMLTYLGMVLLNLLEHKRLGRIDQQLSASYPWLTALHWAHWSPLQAIFLPLMLAITVFCQLYYPGFPLTTLKPS